MKTCPNCGTQYTDETLRFCLQDGGLLETTPVTQQPTLSLAGQEMETVARQGPSGSGDSAATQWKQPQSQVTHISPAQPKSSGSKIALAVTAAALVLLLFVGGGAIGLWLYLSGRGPDNTNKNGNGNRNGTLPGGNNSNILPTPTLTPFPTPTATVSNRNGNADSNNSVRLHPSDDEKNLASREVSQRIYSWKSDTEAGDLNSQMRKYASSVDYYRKRGATPDFIRADKMRAYRMFDSMSVGISNMSVTVGDSGNTATAVFDKEWVFEGTRRSTGKVRQQLQFQKIDGQWLITGERDIKVYYTN